MNLFHGSSVFSRSVYKCCAVFIIVLMLNNSTANYVLANTCLAPKTNVVSTAEIQNANDLLFDSLIKEAYKTQPALESTQENKKISTALNTFFTAFQDISFFQQVLKTSIKKVKQISLGALSLLNNVQMTISKKINLFFSSITNSVKYVTIAILLLCAGCGDIMEPVRPDDLFEGGTIFSIGKNDNSSSEFLAEAKSFEADFFVNENFHDKFPRELNTTWFPDIYIHFELDNASDLTLYLDAAWQNDRGALMVNVDMHVDGNWETVGQAVFNSVDKGFIHIPAEYFQRGMNDMRISVQNANGNTTSIYWDQITLKPTSYSVPQEVVTMTENILDMSLNFYTIDGILQPSGLPPTGFNAKIHSDFKWTNPTEWGYFMQGLILAAEKGKISTSDASSRIEGILNRIIDVQNDPELFHNGLLYSFYHIDSHNPKPITDAGDEAYNKLTVGDCALLWLSTNAIKGWLISNGYSSTAQKATTVMNNFNLRSGFIDNGYDAYMAKSIFSDGRPHEGAWDYMSDEGGMISFAAFASGAITEDEFRRVVNHLRRTPNSWGDYTVEEGMYYNPAFAWTIRMSAGFPFFESGLGSTYGMNSFIPAMESYIAFGKYLNVDYPGFSDAMSQADGDIRLVGNAYGPSDAPHITTAPNHLMPHGLIVPLAGMRYMDQSALKAYYDALVLLRSDINNIWHDTENNISASPYGFEVIMPPKINQPGYIGVNTGRFCFETLSESYSSISAWYGLQMLNGRPTFYDYAKNVNGYNDKVQRALAIMYGGGLKNVGAEDVNLSPEQTRLLKQEIHQNSSEEVKKQINNQQINYKLVETDNSSLLSKIMKDVGIQNGAYNLTINGVNYLLINKDIEHYETALEHEEYEICSREFLAKNPDYLDGQNLNQAAHQVAWSMQIVNNNWEKAEDVDFIKNQITSNNNDALVDLLKEDRNKQTNYVTNVLKSLLDKTNIKEKILLFEQSFKEYAYLNLSKNIKDTIKLEIKTYDIELIKDTIIPIVQQTKDVIDAYSLRNIIYTGLKENNLISTTAIPLNSIMEKLTDLLYKETKRNEMIEFSS